MTGDLVYVHEQYGTEVGVIFFLATKVLNGDNGAIKIN